MRDKKLIPLEVIEKTAAGESEAINIVLRRYAGYTEYLSKYRGHISDDTQDRLKVKLVEAILKFRFDYQGVAEIGKAIESKLRATRP